MFWNNNIIINIFISRNYFANEKLVILCFTNIGDFFCINFIKLSCLLIQQNFSIKIIKNCRRQIRMYAHTYTNTTCIYICTYICNIGFVWSNNKLNHAIFMRQISRARISFTYIHAHIQYTYICYVCAKIMESF